MHHHINHCWCSQSEHNDQSYDAPNMVEINRLEKDADDWSNLIDIKRVVGKEELELQQSIAESMTKRMGIDAGGFYTEEKIRELATRDCPILKEEIQQWLHDNIKDKDGDQGWAMGNDDYRVVQSYQLTLWFQRRNDAKKFIKTFSKYNKATSYFNYLKDPIDNKLLNLETGKYYNRHDD